MSLSYKSAGVDLDLYRQSMGRLPALLARTQAPHSGRVLDLPGGFAGLYRLLGDGRTYRDPVLVSGSDGVGTKIKVAQLAGVHDTVGIDLVAMCVNDCLCLGAEPLFFLDYLALSKDDPDLIEQLVAGVSAGCVEAGAALLGGETAIMPDLYAPGEYDLAGFCVGVVERDRLIDGSQIRPGDAIVGLASNGFHSNGYSLLRRVVFEVAGLSLDEHVVPLGCTVGEALLRPTRIYSEPVASLLQEFNGTDAAAIVGLAHITGGGLAENIDRILPDGCTATIEEAGWPAPPEFTWLGGLADVEPDEMSRAFNMGIGMAAIVRPAQCEAALRSLQTAGVDAWRIGRIE